MLFILLFGCLCFIFRIVFTYICAHTAILKILVRSMFHFNITFNPVEFQLHSLDQCSVIACVFIYLFIPMHFPLIIPFSIHVIVFFFS